MRNNEGCSQLAVSCTQCAHTHTHTHTHSHSTVCQQYACWAVYCFCHIILVQVHSHNRVYYKRAGGIGRIHCTKKKFVLAPKPGLWLMPIRATLACTTVLDCPRGLRLAWRTCSVLVLIAASSLSSCILCCSVSSTA